MTDLFIKSYEKDTPFLCQTLWSIQKFCRGFRQLVLVLERGTNTDFLAEYKGLNIRAFFEEEIQPGYLSQQMRKLNADLYSDADEFLYLDSDTVVIRELTPDSMRIDGKPVWLLTPWTHMPEDAIKAWKPVMKEWMGLEAPAEMMRQFPFLVPRWVFSELRVWAIGRHRMTLEQYIMSRKDRAFSEFNILGFHLWTFHREKIRWWDTTKEPTFPQFVRQFYSYSGVTPEVRAIIEQILA